MMHLDSDGKVINNFKNSLVTNIKVSVLLKLYGVCLSATLLTGCLILDTSRDDDPAYANKMNMITGEFMLQAEQPTPIYNIPQLVGENGLLPDKMGLEEAIKQHEKGGWKTVNYPLTNANDKSNPKSPIHNFKYGSLVYYPPTYQGKDDWSQEFGSEVNASIEYWLARDAIARVIHNGNIDNDERVEETIKTTITADSMIDKTLYISNPQFDTGFWQHLFTKDLYFGLGRVREEGLFAGLRYPERAKVVIIENQSITTEASAKMRDGLNRAALFNDIGMNPEDFGTDDTARKRTYEINEYRSIIRNISYRPFAECKRSTHSIAYFKPGKKLGRAAYICKNPWGNKAGSGIAKMFDSSGMQLTGASRLNIETGLVMTMEFNDKLTLDQRMDNKNYCESSMFKSICEERKPDTMQYLIHGRLRDFLDPTFVVAYTQINKEGQIEGVVLLDKVKFVYDLTNIAKWYTEFLPHTPNRRISLVRRDVQTASLDYIDNSYPNQ